MKKVALLTVVALLAGCAQLGSDSSASAATGNTTSTRMKACLFSEANSRYTAGTLFTNTIRETASDLVKTCTKKLALESAGISAESQTAAENIISNLKTLATTAQ